MRIFGRAQASLLRIQIRKSIHKLIFVSVGLVFSLLSLGVLNHAAYSAIEERLGPAEAGLIVGITDLLLAVIEHAQKSKTPCAAREASAKCRTL